MISAIPFLTSPLLLFFPSLSLFPPIFSPVYVSHDLDDLCSFFRLCSKLHENSSRNFLLGNKQISKKDMVFFNWQQTVGNEQSNNFLLQCQSFQKAKYNLLYVSCVICHFIVICMWGGINFNIFIIHFLHYCKFYMHQLCLVINEW